MADFTTDDVMAELKLMELPAVDDDDDDVCSVSEMWKKQAQH